MGGETLADIVRDISAIEEQLMNRVTTVFGSSGMSVYLTDLFLIGALRRTLAQAKGFRELISTKNFVCAAAILRMQIDTAMRINALELVADPEVLARSVLTGERFDRLKAADGSRLQDAFLRSRLAEKHPWIDEVYKRTSGFVHLSGKHIFSSIGGIDDESRTVNFAIGGSDPGLPEHLYIEAAAAFRHASQLSGDLIVGAWSIIHGVAEDTDRS